MSFTIDIPVKFDSYDRVHLPLETHPAFKLRVGAIERSWDTGLSLPLDSFIIITLSVTATQIFIFHHSYIICTWHCLGKAFVFDDSFEHEVSSESVPNGAARLILIFDVWHAALDKNMRIDAVKRLQEAGY